MKNVFEYQDDVMLLFLFLQVEKEDAPKIEYIYHRYHGEMMRMAKERLKRAGIKSYETDAEDVVQNAFLKICKYIKKIDLGVTDKELRAYVLSIVINESNNFISNYMFIDSLGEDYGEIADRDFFDALSIKDNYNRVIEAIEKMDEIYSITMMYRYTNGMNVRQIAKLMGLSEKTVYTRLSRGKIILLRSLEEKNDVYK